ncbi:citrate lyase subunit beta-like protein [Histoplasma capsulatum var. duboisii H88]|uniref:Citrate lyase subunit beta-like protein n=2 Tax=Ajellomyces capsulatus TaxID=5037 RepID=F0UTI8_AJEC8|nr:citrate lyase subunit beta-like protein [Histoplasma capsulatum H143]EGC49215.1 citrate lyase subunit beta-like protein [Histoplasma capsulatum var. duboisii H88]QSS54812.1 citrate lyase subunit beta-like protein [Histoplasma capsulatum var. duboisii H88]
MASTGTILRRALLYVPGSSQRMLDKSRNLVADCVAYDLEDSVTQTRKAEARTLIRNAIDQPKPSGIKERAVRINSVSSGLALADLTEMLKSPNLTTLVVPKVESASDLHFISDVISHTRSNLKPTESNPDPSKNPPISVIALIESAKSILNLPQICTATTHQLSGLVFAAADFSKDLSITQTPSLTEFLYARSAIVIAACAHGLPSIIDLVCTDFKTPAVLEDEVLNGKRMGFNGKQCIHPSQVELVQQLFSPELKEVEWAVRVIVADTKAAEDGRGAWTLDGMMIDVPVVERSRDIVKKAELCGLDVAALKKKFASEQPQ